MAFDYATQGLSKKQIADKYSVTPATVTNISQTDEWDVIVKGILKEARIVNVSKLTKLAKKSIEVIESVLDDKEAKDSDKIRAANLVLDRVVSKTQAPESGKVILNMISPPWVDKGHDGKSGNNIQIVMSDKEYKK